MTHKIITLFNDLKKNGKIEPIGDTAILRVITEAGVSNKELIKNLTEWRGRQMKWFLFQFRATQKGTKKWLKDLVIDAPDRILFMVESLKGEQIGHMGLNRFNFDSMECEVDNVIRGNNNLLPGIMTKGLGKIIDWAFSDLGVKTLYIRTFEDNEHTVKFYERLGFKKLKVNPLKKVVTEKMTQWIEMPYAKKSPENRYYLKMFLRNPHE